MLALHKNKEVKSHIQPGLLQLDAINSIPGGIRLFDNGHGSDSLPPVSSKTAKTKKTRHITNKQHGLKRSDWPICNQDLHSRVARLLLLFFPLPLFPCVPASPPPPESRPCCRLRKRFGSQTAQGSILVSDLSRKKRAHRFTARLSSGWLRTRGLID